MDKDRPFSARTPSPRGSPPTPATPHSPRGTSRALQLARWVGLVCMLPSFSLTPQSSSLPPAYFPHQVSELGEVQCCDEAQARRRASRCLRRELRRRLWTRGGTATARRREARWSSCLLPHHTSSAATRKTRRGR